MRVKEENEKAGLKLNIKKAKITSSGPAIYMTCSAYILNQQGDHI